MSDISGTRMSGNTISSPAPGTAPRGGGLPWGQWWRQTLAIMRLDLRKGFRRSYGLLLLALAPVFILFLRMVIPEAIQDSGDIPGATNFFAVIFQTFIVRIVIFLACVSIFGNLIRRELLDRSLHYYFLSPVRREVLVVAKFLTGLLVAFVLFGLTTVVSFILTYVPLESTAVQGFLFQGPGLAHLGAYLLVTFLGCVGYGAVFLALGFFFKSPAIPALAVFGWEAILFLLPPLLKKASVFHYLQSLCPIPISEGPLAILADAPSPWVAIPGLLALAVALVALSAWKIRTMEISYEES
ncbi:MAG TPA: ABC transporter permease [Thermoanaerobaculia bacterium]|nr:ABC transporter permease [Thermoanaerobaculia bacterium]